MYKYRLKENPINIGDKSIRNDIESTITNVDPLTGSITWDIKKLPNIQNVFKNFKNLNSSLIKLSEDTEDEFVDEINEEIRDLFNKYRTYIRNNYKDKYNPQIKETSTSGGAGGYLGKFKKKIKENTNPKQENWQQLRINAFDELEQRSLNIRKKLKQAKLKTISYYNQNPNSWEVLYGTDLIGDYFNDIDVLLTTEN